ncbi:hypothetical protein GGX14DRAFT_485386 [Mycena pura]|uniref:Uncharacterized protein n=1 Tax=Mycena pura TaxID=153505 RepID=A0AAD6UN22_9AGAR|nr:hypothetical protein GGX14DRAFT_485386 [Mycena pura]
MVSGPPPYEAADHSYYPEDTRYVYYRVYAPDGMLRCTNGSNPFIVASLKRALVQAEQLSDPSGDITCLFKTRDAQKAMAKGARIDILTGELGATPRTPVALVFLTDPEKALRVSDDDGADPSDELPTREPTAVISWRPHADHVGSVYYRLYNRGGEEHSVRSFDKREPALGIINRDSIAPPRNALCVKRRIARVEGKPIYTLANLFTDTKTDDPYSSTAVVDDAHGSSKEKPILMVLPEHRPGLYNQPVLIVALPSGLGSRDGTNSSQWLSPSPGETLLTDGVAQSMVSMCMPSVEQVYTAVDKNGKTGYAAHSKLVYEPAESSGGCNIQ